MKKRPAIWAAVWAFAIIAGLIGVRWSDEAHPYSIDPSSERLSGCMETASITFTKDSDGWWRYVNNCTSQRP